MCSDKICDLNTKEMNLLIPAEKTLGTFRVTIFVSF